LFPFFGIFGLPFQADYPSQPGPKSPGQVKGAYVPWGDVFGGADMRCPEPDFARAEALRREQPWRDLRRWLRRHKQEIVAVMTLGTAIALYGLVLLVRRRRVAAAA
jgi:hypothetical protein